MIQSGGFLKTDLPLIISVIQSLAKSVLIPLGLTAAASATDAGIHKTILRSGDNTTLIISNNEMKDILEIVKSLENFGLLLEGVSETIKNEAKEQKGGFLSILLGTLGASLLGNMLAGKGVIRAGEELLELAMDLKDLHSKKKIDSKRIPNFEIQAYYQNEPRFKEVYS